MSSRQPFSPLPSVGEVQHIHHLSEDIGKLYQSEDYSDVVLVVNEKRFPAHRVVLAARSEYFRALLFGGMKESSQEVVELKDTNLPAFQHLLRYIYTGSITLASLKEDLILDILGLAHQYGFQDLEMAISDYLKAVLSIRTVCLIYDTSSLYQLAGLSTACLVFMDRHALEVLHHETFLSLSETAVRDIISRDSFCAAEDEIFRAVANWAKANPDQETRAILAEIRLSLLNIQDILKVVRPTELMPADILLDAIQAKTESKDMELRYRGYKMPEENVAVPRHGATVLVGEVKSALLDGDSRNYDMERGFSRHPIDETAERQGIVVKLGMPCIINHIKMLLWDRDQRAYSYYIEISMDQKDWVKVVDHSRYHCRSWQFLYFSPRVARFIRIVGTHNTVNKVFHVVTMEAMYTDAEYNLEAGLLIPKNNIATQPKSATVIEGVCRSRNALLNGETSSYDWDSGYTCHQLGSGAIMVQLGQPYALDSMKLLLWDCDDRSYSYYIEVSVNQRDWEVVCDRTREACRSWQAISFVRRPVVFIRIVGTHNTANEVFHCVHFECPASEDVLHSSPSGHAPCPSTSHGLDMEEEEPQHSAAPGPSGHHLLAPLLMEHDHAVPEDEPPAGGAPAPAAAQHPRHQPSDLFQLPLAAAALPLGPPPLPLGQPLQGLPQGAVGGQGAVPRSARTVRRNNNNNQPSPP